MTTIDNTPDPADRSANIRMAVQMIIDSNLDAMFDRFDALKKRGINDNDMVEALRYLGDIELLDSYAEWGDIDLREDDNTTLNPVVPDPDNPSYAPLLEQLQGVQRIREAHARHFPSSLEHQTGIRVTGTVGFGGVGLEFGRDRDDVQWIRPVGGVWVAVEESK